MSKKIAFEIKESGAPYPDECWWRIKGPNGRILVSSETMGKKHATEIVNKIINYVKTGNYRIKTLPPG